MKCVHCNQDLINYPPTSVFVFYCSATPEQKEYICLPCLDMTHARPTRDEIKQLSRDTTWALNGSEHGVCKASDVIKARNAVIAFFSKYGFPLSLHP